MSESKKVSTKRPEKSEKVQVSTKRPEQAKKPPRSLSRIDAAFEGLRSLDASMVNFRDESVLNHSKNSALISSMSSEIDKLKSQNHWILIVAIAWPVCLTFVLMASGLLG